MIYYITLWVETGAFLLAKNAQGRLVNANLRSASYPYWLSDAKICLGVGPIPGPASKLPSCQRDTLHVIKEV